jgi:uncharacterized membrane protein YhaH (DUF805 family)
VSTTQALDLFFNPNGRIERRAFWLGFAVLTTLGVVLAAARTFAASDSGAALLLAVQAGLLYPLACIYGKRLHDAGRTAWWALAAIAAPLLAVSILNTFLVASTLADLQSVGANAEIYQPLRGDVSRRLFAPLQVGGVGAAVTAAFVVSILRSDPAANRFGPPPERR